MSETHPDEDLRRLLERDGAHTSARHDEGVLAAARAFAGERPTTGAASIRAPRSRWVIPAALAASFVAGALVTRVALDTRSGEAASLPPALVIPLNTTRGSSGRTIPVEQANADDWYHYIQELIAAGETREAEQHLRRFNELHPDYAYQP